MGVTQQETSSSVDLYWLPLGAGRGNGVVRLSGRVYEAWAARRAARPRQALFHSALHVVLRGESFVVEMTPAWGNAATDREWWRRERWGCRPCARCGVGAVRLFACARLRHRLEPRA